MPVPGLRTKRLGSACSLPDERRTLAGMNLTRRSLLRAGLAVSIGGALSSGSAAAAGAQADSPLVIRPRSDWGADLPATGELDSEDVRFLLVHHTASANDYGPDEVVGKLRSYFGYHTSPAKGWPDLAYNFMVDRFGGVWEGRTGSLDGPVQASATGGSQGFAQLACFIGEFTASPPTAAARSSMLRLLAMLAELFGWFDSALSGRRRLFSGCLRRL